MFDANAAHIKIGEKFFAEVHATDKQLEDAGVKVGDILLCEHVEKGDKCPRENLLSKFKTSKCEVSRDWVYDEDSDDWSWLVYSGRPNGNGFISDKWKEKALNFMGGEWEINK